MNFREMFISLYVMLFCVHENRKKLCKQLFGVNYEFFVDKLYNLLYHQNIGAYTHGPALTHTYYTNT